ncbi:putative phosphatase [Candidatus Terasakiella magnetica]|nr:putative phosphatase [Candidatus Terasakiella magnetica]
MERLTIAMAETLGSGFGAQSALTTLGDAALLLPLAGLLVAAVAAKDGGAAVLWAGVIIGGAGIIAAIKIAYYLGLSPLGNVSGHAGLALLVLGGTARYAPLFMPQPWHHLPLRLALTLLAVLIGASRVSLDYHTLGEVIAGAALGLTGIGILARRPLPPTPTRHYRRMIWGVPLLLLLPLTYGWTVTTEPVWQAIALHIAPWLGITPP